ncbi:HAD family phosphatase [Marivirga sp. S37H4]|uniref:HAD family phosphatase n=1 Tax=Marivirga aurantiaca TaxID=2802615 RepID=A0A934X108_9BACT|nr:Cof-type HAD-IIB family hydrolase [Marivirga aurantiaca]MBK6266978.1 HAD family phosphatase [Marivirga aurantiaca]
MYKAICTDIDGTLLNANRKLSERTISAIRSLDDDIPVILASSRMPAAMRHLQQVLGIEKHPLICYNGGYVIDQGHIIRTLDSVTIPFPIARKIASWAEKSSLHASFYFEDHWYAPSLDEWTEREINNTQVQAKILSNSAIISRWHATQTGAHKIMCMGDPQLIDALVKQLKDQKEPLHLYRSKDTYLEIAPLQISKASALALLLKNKYKFSVDDVIAFGDNFNDIELLNVVGKGIAVQNAREELKAVANEITDSAKEDGVAKAIEKYFLNLS